MLIELRRAHSPEELQEETACALCVVPFEVESVVVMARELRDEEGNVGKVCPSCLEYLAARNPRRFPTREEYLSALERHPLPIFRSTQEIIELEQKDPAAAQRLITAGEITRPG